MIPWYLPDQTSVKEWNWWKSRFLCSLQIFTFGVLWDYSFEHFNTRVNTDNYLLYKFEETRPFADSLGNDVFQKNLKTVQIEDKFLQFVFVFHIFAWEADLANKSRCERQKQILTHKRLALQFSGHSMAGWALGLQCCLPQMAVESTI